MHERRESKGNKALGYSNTQLYGRKEGGKLSREKPPSIEKTKDYHITKTKPVLEGERLFVLYTRFKTEDCYQ